MGQEVRGLNLGSVKLDNVLPTARHCCNISSEGAVLLRRNDAEMGPANSFQCKQASAQYSEYNERFDFGLIFEEKAVFKSSSAKTFEIYELESLIMGSA